MQNKIDEKDKIIEDLKAEDKRLIRSCVKLKGVVINESVSGCNYEGWE